MKTDKFPVLIFVSILLTLLFYQNCIADGGGGENPVPICDVDIPSPNYDGPLINGDFTVAMLETGSGNAKRYYDIHVVLEGTKLKKVIIGGDLKEAYEVPVMKLYSLAYSIKANTPPDATICDYEVCHFMEKLKYAACNRNVAQTFGYSKDYFPVLTDIRITRKDNCSVPSLAMIKGKVKIRITRKKLPCKKLGAN